MRRSVCLFAALSLGFAPLPFPRLADPKSVDELARVAKVAEVTAELLQGRLLEGDPTPLQRSDLVRRRRDALDRAASDYARLARMVERSPDPKQRALATDAALRGGRARISLGQYPEALTIYRRLADRTPDPKARVTALGGCVQCHAALADNEGVRRTLALLRQDVPRLEPPDRQEWTKWADRLDGEFRPRGK